MCAFFFILIRPQTNPEDSDFGDTKLYVEGGRMSAVPSRALSLGNGNCHEKSIFQLFKAISFPSSFVKTTVLGMMERVPELMHATQ